VAQVVLCLSRREVEEVVFVHNPEVASWSRPPQFEADSRLADAEAGVVRARDIPDGYGGGQKGVRFASGLEVVHDVELGASGNLQPCPGARQIDETGQVGVDWRVVDACGDRRVAVEHRALTNGRADLWLRI
jgi:hypothetical protein